MKKSLRMNVLEKVLVLGPEGTYSHEAAVKIIDSSKARSVEIVPQRRNLDVLHSAEAEKCFGIVPIENSSAGLVDIVKTFWLHQARSRQQLYVVGEVSIPVRHYLLAKKGIGISDLESVMSHPQALSQCAGSLDRLGIDIRTPANSTAGAAQELASMDEGSQIGAIASSFAADIYGLEVLGKDLQDFSGNSTKFHLVAPSPMPMTGNDRTAVIFNIPNEPNALMNALWAPGSQHVNMSSIHSIPSGELGDYAFYLEFDCHQDSLTGKKILDLLALLTKQLIVLGSFPKGVEYNGGET